MIQADYKVYIDWDGDGSFEGGDEDVSADVQMLRIVRGKESQLGHAPAGTCEILLKDLDSKYSPENSLSPLYGLLLPGREVAVSADLDESPNPLFSGFINKIVPHPHWNKKNTYIYALDGINRLASGIIPDRIFHNTCQAYISGDTTLTFFTQSTYAAQIFVPESNHYITGVSLKLKIGPWEGEGASSACVSIRAASGGQPTGSDLVAAGTRFFTEDDQTSGGWFDFPLPTLALRAGTEYAIVVYGPIGSDQGWRRDSTGGYSRGGSAISSDYGVTWTTYSNRSFMFKEYCK